MTKKKNSTITTTSLAPDFGRRRRSPRIAAQVAPLSSSLNGVSRGSTSNSSSAFFSTLTSSSPDHDDDEPVTGRNNDKRNNTNNNKKKKEKKRLRSDDDYDDDYVNDDDGNNDAPSMVPLSRSSTESTAVTTHTSGSSSSSSSSSVVVTEKTFKLLPESLSRHLELKILSDRNSVKQSSSASSSSVSTTTTTTTKKKTTWLSTGSSPEEQQYFVDNYVIGVDEAGRGPLAGPVVCAAVVVPMRMNNSKEDVDDDPFHPTKLRGVVDSKKLTKEEDREQVYEQLMMMSRPSSSQSQQPCIRWAVSVIDAKRIDEINILQATMEGMRSAVQTVMGLDAIAFNIEDLQRNKKKKNLSKKNKKGQKSTIEEENEGNQVAEKTVAPDPPSAPVVIRQVQSASVEENGCYVVTSESIASDKNSSKGSSNGVPNYCYYALVDGNRLPHDMPCDGESVVKGDSKEFCIAAASILAKVTRDRLMRQYDKLYPEYNLEQHKGYPTAAHMSAVKQYGASPIHRLTFAPLKHMEFDDDGKVVAR